MSTWIWPSSHIIGLRNVAGFGSGVIRFEMNNPSCEARTQDQYCAWSGTSIMSPVNSRSAGANHQANA